MRLGELLALQWNDFDWRGRYVLVSRSLVRGALTTPKNHQRRRVDLSRQLRVTLRLWRRQQRALWLKAGQPRPDWVFSSATGTALDESNVRKAFNRILDKAELHLRGPHQMRHSFASLLLAAGEPITYVSRQLGHRDASITLRVYAHWLPDTARRMGVDRLDDADMISDKTPPMGNQWATRRVLGRQSKSAKWFGISGEPGGNRTPNPQIKSLLLCQLSYRPG